MADRVLTVRVTGDTSGLGRSFSKASKTSQSFGDSMHHHVTGVLKEVGKAAEYAGGVIGISLVGALGDAVKVAGDNQVAVTKLRKAVENSGHSWKAWSRQVQETQDRLAGLSGFTNTDLENSLATLVTTTGKVTAAQNLQSHAMDLARARGMSLSQASTILSKVWNGNTTSLSRLGIYLPKVTKAYDHYMATTKHTTVAGKAAAKAADLVSSRQAALAALQKKYGGSWTAYGRTGEGALSRIRASAEILLEKLGKVMLPYLNRLATWFTKNLPRIQADGTQAFGALRTAIQDVANVVVPMIGWMNRNRDVVLAAAVAVGVLTAAIEVYAAGKWLKAAIVGTENMTAAQAALNFVLDANPIGIAVIALAALAAGFVIAYNRSTTFRNVVNHVLHDVQIAFGAVTGFIHDHWGSVAGFIEARIRNVWTVVSGIYGFIRDHWKTILGIMTGGWSTAVMFIINHWGTIKSVAGKVITFVINRWGNIKSAISTFAGWVNHYVIGPIKTIIAWAKRAISWIEKLNPFSHGGGPSATTGGAGGTISRSGTAGANQRLAQSMLPSYGFSGSQMSPLVSLWNQESGWSNYAYNASSGATGIPQALPYSKMPRAAWLPSQGGQASPTAQIGWGLGYIKGRYGSPAGAWAHEQRYNWYDQGGIVPGPRGVHRPIMAAGGETILPTHKAGGGWGPTIVVNIDGVLTGTEQQVQRVVRRAVIDALRHQGPNAFKTASGLRP